MRHRHFARLHARRRRARHKKAALISGILALLIIGIVAAAHFNPANFSEGRMGFPAFAKDKENTRDKNKKAPYTASPEWPEHTTTAAIGMRDEGIIATHGDDTVRPTASIAKVITALAVLDKYPIKPDEDGPTVPITTDDEAIYHDYVAQGGSVVGVQAGVDITLRQALDAMILPSANNVADTTVIWAFGSMDEYHDYANDMLQRMGLTDTKVGGDASGLSPKTKSTPSDLLALGEIALDNPTLSEIVGSQEMEWPGTGIIQNYNRLVTQNDFTGLKPGLSDEAGSTMLFSTKHTIDGEEKELIGVVLGVEEPQTAYKAALQITESTQETIKKIED